MKFELYFIRIKLILYNQRIYLISKRLIKTGFRLKISKSLSSNEALITNVVNYLTREQKFIYVPIDSKSKSKRSINIFTDNNEMEMLYILVMINNNF